MTTLYRLYDSADQLLYVGIAEHWGTRFNRHHETKPWFAEVANVRLEQFATRDEALRAEADVIRAEHPQHNIVHNGKPNPSHKNLARRHTRRPSRLEPGAVVAMGMKNGECPVGIVTSADDTFVVLDLYSWITGYFGYQTRAYRIGLIDELLFGEVLNDPPKWMVVEKGQVVYDIDPLADFQTRWLHPDLTNEQIYEQHRAGLGRLG